jgi:hypothetical protein
MPKLNDVQLAKARQIFFAKNPMASVRIMTLTQAEADILGVSLAELQEVETYRAIEAYARDQGVDTTELLFMWGAADRDEYDRLMAERQAEIKKALGI